MRDETPDTEPSPETGLGTENLEAGEEARKTVRHYLDARRDTLWRMSRGNDENKVPIATINTITDGGEDSFSTLSATQLRELLYWADRGLNSAWQQLEVPEEPREPEPFRVGDLPQGEKTVLLIKGVPTACRDMGWALERAKELTVKTGKTHTVILVPSDSVESCSLAYRVELHSHKLPEIYAEEDNDD